jgi:hypothetical protein
MPGRILASARSVLLGSAIAVMTIYTGDIVFASSSPAVFYYNLGPDFADCPAFDLHLAFSQGRITYEGVKTPDGSFMPWKFGTGPQVPMTLSVGSGSCTLYLKLDRQPV